MNDPKAKPDQQAKTDLVDNHGGAYNPVSKHGIPQPAQVREDSTAHHVPSVPLPGEDVVLPEGLKRPRVGPDHKPVERR